MTLKELQNMIKEEFDAFRNEAEDEVDVSVSDADVDAEMGDEMGDEMAPEGEEDVLRKIYDLLDAHFNPAEDEMGDEEMPPMDDMGGEEEADLEEVSKTGYDAKVGGKGSTGYDAGSKALQERFQKLANIIK